MFDVSTSKYDTLTLLQINEPMYPFGSSSRILRTTSSLWGTGGGVRVSGEKEEGAAVTLEDATGKRRWFLFSVSC